MNLGFKEWLISGFIPLLLGLFFGFFVGAMLGHFRATNIERERAVETGAGRWTVDEKTGETLFRYGQPYRP